MIFIADRIEATSRDEGGGVIHAIDINHQGGSRCRSKIIRYRVIEASHAIEVVQWAEFQLAGFMHQGATAYVANTVQRQAVRITIDIACARQQYGIGKFELGIFQGTQAWCCQARRVIYGG